MNKQTTNKTVEALKHDDATRRNIPTAEFQSVMNKEDENPVQVAYERRNKDLDPQLVWRGKDAQDWSDLVVQAPPLYIQEKVHPKVLIDDLLRFSQPDVPAADAQLELFSDFNGIPDGADKTEFYQHDQNWSNRMILGDSLQVMASLAEREGLRGKVQCIYLDPPYGIKFNSNFQWSTTSRDVKDGNIAHITREPEQVKAFRDTWRDGIHSYLTYLRDRFTVARDLLTDSGSIFVQIGEENVHRVRAVMDEVFGEDNFVSQIHYTTTSGFTTGSLSRAGDYVIWYAKQKDSLKYRDLYSGKADPFEDEKSKYDQLEYPNLQRRSLTKADKEAGKIPEGGRVFRFGAIDSQDPPPVPTPFSFLGHHFNPSQGRHWTANYPVGMNRLKFANRLGLQGRNIAYIRYFEDFNIRPLHNLWADIGGTVQSRSDPKIYVVQTGTAVIQRCVLMTTDPSDLVLDPTCVRKGTRVITPLNPPASGGRQNATSAGDPAPSPLAGRVGVGCIPPGVRCIEDLQPGDFVYAHDGLPHSVVRTTKRRYSGKIIGISHAEASQPLWLTEDHLVLSARQVKALSPNGEWSDIPATHVDFARQMRHAATPPEATLWSRLRGSQLGVTFRRQHQIGPYIADFYCRQAGLVVEVDGAGVHSSDDATAYDAQRDAYMTNLGLKVMRYTATEVCNETNAVLEAILHATRESVLPEDPQKQWRYAGNLAVGDTVYVGVHRQPTAITRIVVEETTEEVYDLEVEGVHSFLTDVCAVHNCGSGTTAYVAEQWGRRWITIDTSRVALALARARIMGARYPFYLLADSREGQLKEADITRTTPSSQPVHGNILHGFVYERVPHITLKSIANNAEIDVIWDRYQETLEPLRNQLNQALGKGWQEWEIPREAEDPWDQDSRGLFHHLTSERAHSETSNTRRIVELLHDINHNLKRKYTLDTLPERPADPWPEPARKLHAEWWQARIARQKEIDTSIAARAEFEYLYDKPYEDKKKVRVAGPFTVESLSPHRVLGVDENDELIDRVAERGPDFDETQTFAQMILENLRTSGVQQAHKEDRITFTSLTPWPGDLVCAEGRYIEDKAPLNSEYTPLNPPASGGKQNATSAGDPAQAKDTPLSPPASGGKQNATSAGDPAPFPLGGSAGGTPAPSPLAGRGGVGYSASTIASTEKRAAIFIGPEFGTVTRQDLVLAAREAGDAGFDVLIACAFNYEAHTTEFNKLGRIPVLKARMNADLHMADDLKNTGKGNLFVIFGEPDIDILPVPDGKVQVKVNGVDVFHPSTGEVRSDGADGIACWFIDTDYNDESFFVRHAYFLGANDPYSALKTTLKAEINEEAWSSLNSDTSRPFDKPKSGRIAVKVINHLGDEVMKVFKIQ